MGDVLIFYFMPKREKQTSFKTTLVIGEGDFSLKQHFICTKRMHLSNFFLCVFPQQLDTDYFHVKENFFSENQESVASFPVPYDLPLEQYGSKGKLYL